MRAGDFPIRPYIEYLSPKLLYDTEEKQGVQWLGKVVSNLKEQLLANCHRLSHYILTLRAPNGPEWIDNHFVLIKFEKHLTQDAHVYDDVEYANEWVNDFHREYVSSPSDKEIIGRIQNTIREKIKKIMPSDQALRKLEELREPRPYLTFMEKELVEKEMEKARDTKKKEKKAAQEKKQLEPILLEQAGIESRRTIVASMREIMMDALLWSDRAGTNTDAEREILNKSPEDYVTASRKEIETDLNAIEKGLVEDYTKFQNYSGNSIESLPLAQEIANLRKLLAEWP